jgi:apolipoprotein N-acyltransferase
LLGGVVALAVDGINSFLLDVGMSHPYQPNNYLRLATGLLTGLAMALLLVPLLNRLFWRSFSEERSVGSWQELLQYLPLLGVCFFAVASQNILLLYPIALLSTIGIMIAVSSLNLIALVGISRRDETFERYRELLPFLAYALLLALGEMLLLAQLKLTLLSALGL